jgi:disks large protein 1
MIGYTRKMIRGFVGFRQWTNVFGYAQFFCSLVHCIWYIQCFLLDKFCRKMYTIFSAVLHQQRKMSFGHSAHSAVYYKEAKGSDWFMVMWLTPFSLPIFHLTRLIICIFSDAHRALELLEEYHSKLTSQADKPLRTAIERVIRIFKSRLFQALLGKQYFHQCSFMSCATVS